jgi:hypothetical protein
VRQKVGNLISVFWSSPLRTNFSSPSFETSFYCRRNFTRPTFFNFSN